MAAVRVEFVIGDEQFSITASGVIGDKLKECRIVSDVIEVLSILTEAQLAHKLALAFTTDHFSTYSSRQAERRAKQAAEEAGLSQAMIARFDTTKVTVVNLAQDDN